METTPPPNGKPTYREMYELNNQLRAEFSGQLSSLEARIVAEIRASESRTSVELTRLDQRRESADSKYEALRTEVIRVGAVVAALMLLANLFAPYLSSILT